MCALPVHGVIRSEKVSEPSLNSKNQAVLGILIVISGSKNISFWISKTMPTMSQD